MFGTCTNTLQQIREDYSHSYCCILDFSVHCNKFAIK